MSTHKIEVVPVKLERHPNADSLSIVRVYGAYTVCVRTEDWQNRTKGIYVEPDYVVDTTRPEFAFLKTESRTEERIKVKRLRGIVSQGLLIPAPDDSVIGECFMERLGVYRYEPPINNVGGQATSPPNLMHAKHASKYDMENWRRYNYVFEPGEEVFVTEKLHGSNYRVVWDGEKLHVGSRTEWKSEDYTNVWWVCIQQNPWLVELAKRNPKKVLYGELVGQVTGFDYGTRPGHYTMKIFDVLQEDSNYMDYDQFIQIIPEEHRAPLIFKGSYEDELMESLVEGQSLLSNHIREGIVIKPVKETRNEEVGRKLLKLVSNAYLSK